MSGRSQYEARLLDVLDDISSGANADRKTNFCVTYKLAQKDHDAAWKAALPMILGYKAEIVSILQYNITEAFDVAETLDVGVLDGDEDAYLDGATVPVLGIGASQRVGFVAGVGGYAAIPATGAAIVVTGTSAGTVGICDYAITIRYYL